MWNFSELPVSEYKNNFFNEIGNVWGLLTAGSPDAFNSMTVSWGQAGVLWGMPVCTVYIRPSRHTFGFANGGDKLSLCFLPEKYRSVMRMYGTKSGRDTDKTSEGGLTVLQESGYTCYAEADTVFLLRVLYKDDLRAECFLDGVPENCYPGGADLHRAYVCKIEKIYRRS